jgi:hypothetical protein
MKLSKTKVVSFSRKTNTLIYDYTPCQSSVSRHDSIKDLAIFLYSKLPFHIHANYICSHCIKMLGLVPSIALTFPSLECTHRLYEGYSESYLR